VAERLGREGTSFRCSTGLLLASRQPSASRRSGESRVQSYKRGTPLIADVSASSIQPLWPSIPSIQHPLVTHGRTVTGKFNVRLAPCANDIPGETAEIARLAPRPVDILRSVADISLAETRSATSRCWLRRRRSTDRLSR